MDDWTTNMRIRVLRPIKFLLDSQKPHGEVVYGSRRELERLLPESARRHGLTQSGFIQAQDSDRAPSASEPVPFKATTPFLEPSGPPGEPPPRRVTVLEPPMDHLANPVTGYASLGRPQNVRAM